MDQAVLSQTEIDSLLEAMDSGEIDEETIEEPAQSQVRPYDFRKPVRLSKEYLSTISMVLEDFAKITVNQLASKLRQQVKIKMLHIEQISFDEFLNSVPKFTLIGALSSQPQSGLQLIEINPSISMQMMEILTGYEGEGPYQEDKTKESFTDIELAILEDIVDVFASSFKNAWKDTIELDTRVENVETNPQLLQSMSPNEPVVLATFSMDLNGNETFMNVCIPYIFFEDMLDRLSFRNWFHQGKDTETSDYDRFAESLQPVPLELKTLLGESEISIADFLSMEEGDVVQLNDKVSKPLTMYIEDEPYFYVKPGTKENQLAIEVLQFIGEDESYE